MKTFLTLSVSLLCLCPLVSFAQVGSTSFDAYESNGHQSPLEVIRNIDQLLGKTKLEALQSGDNKAYNDQLNIAKSFVHAGKYGAAQSAYETLLQSVWGNPHHGDLHITISEELKRANRALSKENRPDGLDENYQPTAYKPISMESRNQRYNPYDAANKIDQMLSFLVESIYQKKDQQLNLKGRLNSCRHLIIMEQFDEAKVAYHEAIIDHLDPKWTSQLLEDINQVLSQTDVVLTPSEINTSMRLTMLQATEEVKLLLNPVTEYYAGNQPLAKGNSTFFELLANGNQDDAFKQYEETYSDFVSADWLKERRIRIEAILGRVNANPSSNNMASELNKNEAPILYFFEEQEGRTIEQIRIIEDYELMTYKKVSHNWGGKYFFINDDPTKETEWLRVFRLYETQEDTSVRAE